MDLRGNFLANRRGVSFVNKNYKKLYGYVIIMVVCVLIIVLMAAISKNRIDEYKGEYLKQLDENQTRIQELEKQIADLTDQNQQLKKELEKGQSLGSDLVTLQQAMSDLRSIYQTYKSGNAAEAKKQLDKIEPIGFDDTTLSYYEVLCDLIK